MTGDALGHAIGKGFKQAIRKTVNAVIGGTIGGFIGGFLNDAFGAIPMLWGDDYFSAASMSFSLFIGMLNKYINEPHSSNKYVRC